MSMGGLLWIIVVGFIAGLIARWLAPGPNNPSGFILTTILGIAGAFLATFIGQAIGHYSPDQGAGFIMATIGAVVVLFTLVHTKPDYLGAVIFSLLIGGLYVRTKSVGACVLAHAVANLVLGIYVMATRQWGFW
jgi:uncharacterized membrane protein YeaQ/YmgE (transglycosylase-associated protein family)